MIVKRCLEGCFVTMNSVKGCFGNGTVRVLMFYTNSFLHLKTTYYSEDILIIVQCVGRC